MSLEKTVVKLMNKLERQCFGKYRGFVVDNEDPEKLGRLKLQVPSVLGGEVVTGWAFPCLPYGGNPNVGMLFVPEVGAGVWVEFEEGDIEFPLWVGTFWSKPDGDNELPKPNDDDGAEQDEVKSPPTRKMIKTAKGHSIQFEDADGEETVIIVHMVDDSHRNVVVMNSDGIQLTDFTQNSIQMTADAVTIVAKADFTLDASGKTVQIKGSDIQFVKA